MERQKREKKLAQKCKWVGGANPIEIILTRNDKNSSLILTFVAF
jgi:hypothetical protein